MKVLITTDGSTCSQEAIDSALRLLTLSGAEIVVMSVAPLPVPSPYEYVDAAVVQQLTDTAEALARKAVDQACGMLEARGLHATARLEEGSPADEILRVAQELMPDLLVIGSHGRGALGRLFLGSVSETVVHRWRGPVLLVQQTKGAIANEPAENPSTVTQR